MKTITCSQLGGYCGQKLKAYTWEAMALVIVKHFTEKHAKKLAKHLHMANTKEPMEWVAVMKPKWDAAPEQE
jgi:predicted small metal-binding protein